MNRTQFSLILGVSIATSLIGMAIVVAHHSIKSAISAQADKSLCFNLASAPRCYSTEVVLSHQPTTAIAASPDGKILVSSHQKTIDVWDLSSVRRLRSLSGHADWITSLAISPDSRTLASSSLDGAIALWNLQTGEQLTSLKGGSVTTLAFSPDGTTIASASRLASVGQPQPIRLWNWRTGQVKLVLNAGEPITAIAFSPDGQTLAAGTTSTKVWNLATRKLVHVLNSGDLNALIFSRDGLLLTGSDGVRGEDGIKLWNATGKLVRVLDSVAADFALTADGTTLITTYGGTANIWRMGSFGYLGTLRGSDYSGLTAEFGWGGRAIATGSSDGVKVWYPLP